MSNRFKTAVIDDVTSRNIDANLRDHLLDLFESAMKSVATTLVREAKFDTTDFATAKARGCEGFTLLVSAFWLVGNSLGLAAFVLQHQWITALLYVYFTVSCVQGLRHWARAEVSPG